MSQTISISPRASSAVAGRSNSRSSLPSEDFVRSQRSSAVVVDSSLEDYREFRAATANERYDVVFCSNGAATLRLDPIEAPELWIINAKLPDITGLELVSFVRWRYPNAKICVISDEYSTADEVGARCAGAEWYFAKPVASDWLISAIHAAATA